jgi:hypothetical protein
VSRTIVAIAGAIVVAVWLLRTFLRDRERRRHMVCHFFAGAASVLKDGELQPTQAMGLPCLVGRYRDLPVRILPVIDTLPARRLPALWLLVTVQSPMPTSARFDLMMRPTGPTTFSNFDLLPVTVSPPPGFPEEAVLRTDDPEHMLPPHVIIPHLDVFRDVRAKELLISSNGVRLVWLTAEANRARYAVFREADFDDVELDPDVLRNLLDRLVALRQAILHQQSSCRQAIAWART